MSSYSGDTNDLANSGSTNLTVENQASSGGSANSGNTNGAAGPGGPSVPLAALLIGVGIVAVIGTVAVALFRLRSGRRSQIG